MPKALNLYCFGESPIHTRAFSIEAAGTLSYPLICALRKRRGERKRGADLDIDLESARGSCGQGRAARQVPFLRSPSYIVAASHLRCLVLCPGES